MLGLGTKVKPVVKVQQKNDSKPQAKDAKASSQADEAKALLAKMAAKKDAGDCPFC